MSQMLINYNLMSIFKKYKILSYTIFTLIIVSSCQEAKYSLDNPSDPENMELDPPALFFHPPEIDSKLDTVVSVEVYGLELLPASAAHLKIKYDWGMLQYDSTQANEFFKGNNNPVVVDVPEQGLLNIYLYYLPDLFSDQNDGGTWSLATIYFTTYAEGESDLEFDTEITTLRDFSNNPVPINEFGMGKINID